MFENDVNARSERLLPTCKASRGLLVATPTLPPAYQIALAPQPQRLAPGTLVSCEPSPRNAVAFTVPLTSSGYPGVEVPMPTRPVDGTSVSGDDWLLAPPTSASTRTIAPGNTPTNARRAGFIMVAPASW